MINVFHCLGFLDRIMYTMDPNNHFRPMIMTGMDGNGYNMINDGYLPVFATMGGIVGPRESKIENLGFLGLTVLEKKNHRLRVFAE